MPPLPSPPSDADYERLIHAARLELEMAGNPAYVTAICDGQGSIHVSPIVFSSIGPSTDHARHCAVTAGETEDVYIVSRQAEGRRQQWTILTPATLKKVHVRHEVIEASLDEERSATL